MISKEEIKKLADMARIEVNEEEAESLRGDMESILDYVKTVDQFHSDNSSVQEQASLEKNQPHNVMREDEEPADPEICRGELIAEFPESENDYLKVKKIL